MTEAMTPAEALRAMADNLDSGIAAMEGIEFKVDQDPWREPSDPDGLFAVMSLVRGAITLRRKPTLTPAQQAGWKVGDVGWHLITGEVLIFNEDDGSQVPYWQSLEHSTVRAIELCRVERLLHESECKGHD